MKKILVTGGSGFIGTNLLEFLRGDNHHLVSLDNYSTGSKINHIDKVQYVNGNILNIDELVDSNFDICFHLAAQSRVQPSFEDPIESYKSNVTGTLKVANWANKNNIKLVYAGSSSKHHDPSDSPYAMTKFMGEEICKLYSKTYQLDVQIARFYNVYGPYESIDEKYGNVIGIWRSLASKGKPLKIVGDGEQRRDFTHVKDIVSGLYEISKTNIINDDTWELGSGINYSINQLFQMFKKRFNVEPIYIEDQPGNYRSTLRTNDDMLKKLNWKPEDRLSEYIKNIK